MNITLHGKSLEVRLTAAAQKALAKPTTPRSPRWSCCSPALLRKRVHFGESADEATPVSDRLAVRCKPIMTRRCSVAEGGAAPPSENFALENPRRYVPNWLAIDCSRGAWVGEFGYAD